MDPPSQVVFVDDLVHVVQDLIATGDRVAAPRLESVAKGEKIAVGANAGIVVSPPCAAETGLGLD